MKVTQVYALMNKYASMIQGNEGLAVMDLSSFASFGDAVLGSQDAKDNFLNVLSGDIAKTVVRTLDLEVNYPKLMVNAFTYGTFLRKLTVKPILAQTAESWNVGENDFTPTNFKIDKPDATEKLFTGITPFEFDLTIPDRLFYGAFKDPENMGAFITAIIDALSKSVILYVNYANRMCLNLAIAKKINDDKNVIHLLTEYNATIPEASAISDANIALINPDFLRFAGKRVTDMVRYMREPNRIFNIEKEVRATTRDNMHVFMLGEFMSATDRFLQADVWHNSLTEMPNYQEVIAFQGLLSLRANHANSNKKGAKVGDDPEPVLDTLPNFESASTINVKIGESNDTNADIIVNQSYIIGALFDRQALFTTVYDNRMHTDRNNRNEYTNYTNIVDIGHGIDESEQGCVFVID